MIRVSPSPEPKRADFGLLAVRSRSSSSGSQRWRSDRLAVILASAAVSLSAVTASVALEAPVRLTLDGAAGARPGMTAAAVSAAWRIRLRPTYDVRPGCGQALIDERGLEGYAIFMPRGRFGAVFLRRGAITGRGIRIGTHVSRLRRTYPVLTSRPDRYIHGGRQYFLRRARAPRWELRFDVSPGERVTRIVFGNRDSVRLDEGCA